MCNEALRGAEMRWLLQVLASSWRLGRSFTRYPMVSDVLASTSACDSMEDTGFAPRQSLVPCLVPLVRSRP